MMKKKPIALLTLASVFALLSAGADEHEKIKVLHVTGGGFHDYDTQTKIINETLKSAFANMDITVSAVPSSRDAPVEHPAFDKEDWADGYDLVLYNMCNSANANKPKLVRRITKPHQEGLPAIVVHCTMHCFRPEESGEWNKFLGIESRGHESHAPVKVTFLEKDHPILDDLPKVWQIEKGELYRVISEGENVVPYATGISNGNVENTVVWTNTYGKGRVFGTTLGHFNEEMLAKEFQTMLKNGTRWALGMIEED